MEEIVFWNERKAEAIRRVFERSSKTLSAHF
jgi:hypothetical protein